MRARRGRGEGEIEQLPSGKWRATFSAGYDAGGKRRRLRHTFATKREALDWLREQARARARGTLADDRGQTLDDWLTRWLAQHALAVEHSTHQLYTLHVDKHIRPRLGAFPLGELRPAHVADWLSALPHHPNTRLKILRTLNLACSAALSMGLISINPCAAVRRPKSVRAAEIHPLTVEEARRLLMAAQAPRDRALIALALDSGMRQGELFGLHWPQVDLERGVVSVIQSVGLIKGMPRLKDVKTASSRRRIRVSEQTVDKLRRWGVGRLGRCLSMRGEGC